MATSTNLGLYLPTREDYISVKRDLSDNYEIIDAAVGGNTQGIAQIQSETDIVINGATSTSNVTIGQFVTVRNSSITGIVDGVYKALANVTAGTSFVAANLQAVTGGALNKIVSDMDSMMQQQENDMDIVIRGNTASVNVAAGQFVTVRNSTIANISDGIYKAANNVSSGVAFTDADLDDISSGALNELVSDLATLNDHIVSIPQLYLENVNFQINAVSQWNNVYYKDDTRNLTKTPKDISKIWAIVRSSDQVSVFSIKELNGKQLTLRFWSPSSGDKGWVSVSVLYEY